MKNAMVQLGLVMIGIVSIHAVKLLQTSTIHARISPATAAEKVWAIHGKDSLRMMSDAGGHYYFVTLHPGSWDLKVDARKPYKDIIVKSVDVRPGMEKDMGEFTLIQ
jgi:lauroyl/myristoyl acyltransferase